LQVLFGSFDAIAYDEQGSAALYSVANGNLSKGVVQ
jgi:hypothetical protein